MSRCATKPVNPQLFENGAAFDQIYVNTHEKVNDVAWSGGRKPAVGDNVALSIPSWSNDIGEAQLLVLWQDPDFNAGIQAFSTPG